VVSRVSNAIRGFKGVVNSTSDFLNNVLKPGVDLLTYAAVFFVPATPAARNKTVNAFEEAGEEC